MIRDMNENVIANELISRFLANKDSLSYANTGSDNTYLGWVTDFRLSDSFDQKIRLDLRNVNDLFLLFVLAIVWSRTGPWENAAYFVAHLKVQGKHRPDFWSEKRNCEDEMSLSKSSALNCRDFVKGFDPRKKISFRADLYDSIYVLATNWNLIIDTLEQSERTKNFDLFIDQMRNIEGLGVGRNKMLIKIPLILRELRCQAIYANIPGAYCCVPDARVYKAAKNLGINLPALTTLNGLKASSSKIYSLFGDLYDLPLFAYSDLVQ